MNQINKKKYFRTKIFVYPKFQYTIIIVNILIAFITLVINLFQIHKSFSNFYDLGKSLGLNEENAFFKLIDIQLNQVYASIATAFIISSMVSFVITALLSHRIAGPMYRLIFYFKRLSVTGTIESELRFRKGDFFKELPEVVNDALKRLSNDSKKS